MLNNNFDSGFLRRRLLVYLLIGLPLLTYSQNRKASGAIPGFESRIKKYIDSLPVIDTHEHLIDPETLKDSYFLDFSLLLMQNGYDDLVSAGMPENLFDELFNKEGSPAQKWSIIETAWQNSFNTSFNRIILNSIRDLYGIDKLDASTVDLLSEKIRNTYENSDWTRIILEDSCRIKYLIKDGEQMPGLDSLVRYEKRYEEWLSVNSKYRIDSIAILQVDPIYTLEDFVNSLRTRFEKDLKSGMIAVKVFSSYYRTLDFDDTPVEEARKIFRSLVNGEEDFSISQEEAKPLQDYMLFRLLNLARKNNIPVAFHTGMQAGRKKILGYTDPTLLTNLFRAYPEINFILYHGSYPYGGELSALAKSYKNVYIDMNWMYAVSPTYAKRYLNEWIEMVPVSRLTAFGGDAMVAENVYSELKIAKGIVADVLTEKVAEGYFSEEEAKKVALMMFYENALKLYKF